MSLLTIIDNVCAELSLSQPNSVISSSDRMIIQLRALCQSAGDDLAREYDWSALTILRSFPATGVTPEPNEPPADWQQFRTGSVVWNNSRLWQLNGPVPPQEWQRLTIINSQPVPQIYRILGKKLAIYPNVAGETISYEYQTANWIVGSDGTTYKSKWAADDDAARIPERLIELSLIWRWKRAKGLDYGEEMVNFERLKESEIGSDRASTPFSLSKPNRGQVPDNWWPGTITVGP